MSGPAPSTAAPGGPRGAALWVVAALAGGLHTASFAPTGAWYLQPAALALLAALTARAGVRHAALAGWVFGVAWLASGLWWLYISLHDFGHLAPPLAAAAVGLLAAFLALYPALALAAWARWRPAGPAAAAAAFAAWWTLSELARGQWFTGFPWIAGGYAHTDGPWAGWAPWLGVYGLGALAAWAGAAAGLALAGWRAAARDPERTERLGGARRDAARAAAVLLLPPLLAAAAGPFLARDFTTGTGTLSVSLLQPAVPQDRKFDQAFIDAALAWHVDQIARAPGALVVSPESSLPLLPQQIDAEGWAGLVGPVSAPGRGALLGLFTGGPTEGWMNSMIGLSADSRPGGGGIYRYGKRHLLPFGEFIPPGFGWFVAMLGIPIGDQVAGTVEAPFAAAGQRLRPLICYEDLFGEDIAGGVVGEGGATVLVNASNLAWFGTRMVQDQHLQFSRMRALEFQRPLVRSTNTGATAAIDHRGRVTARLPAAVEGRLDTTVEGRTGDTPFARWVHAAGLAPLWIAGLGLLVALGWQERRRVRR